MTSLSFKDRLVFEDRSEQVVSVTGMAWSKTIKNGVMLCTTVTQFCSVPCRVILTSSGLVDWYSSSSTWMKLRLKLRIRFKLELDSSSVRWSWNQDEAQGQDWDQSQARIQEKRQVLTANEGADCKEERRKEEEERKEWLIKDECK